MKKVIICYLSIFLILISILSYNKLILLDEIINGTWAQVENQLKRRADLIPNLVNTVKGYAAHEESILTEVSQARSKLIGASSISEKAEADANLSDALSRLLAISESYPELKADANFRQLSDELAGTENRIATARMDYILAVQIYNSKIRRIPYCIFAKIFGFTEKEYFNVDGKDYKLPSVDFKGD